VHRSEGGCSLGIGIGIIGIIGIIAIAVVRAKWGGLNMSTNITDIFDIVSYEARTS
jgi:hypothetical protein